MYTSMAIVSLVLSNSCYCSVALIMGSVIRYYESQSRQLKNEGEKFFLRFAQKDIGSISQEYQYWLLAVLQNVYQ